MSTIELEELLVKENIVHLDDINEQESQKSTADTTNSRFLNKMDLNFTQIQNEFYNHHGGGSGGYLENVLVYAAKELFNYDLDINDIVYTQLKNTDFKEVNLIIDGECKLKFAMAYGFRNIQNIVQKLKKNNCPYHYIEIMACPSGKNFKKVEILLVSLI